MRELLDDKNRTLELGEYLSVVRRRFWFLVIPFLLVAGVGSAVAMLLPPIYVAEGRLLVESQQIPSELVRPTITASAKERIQIIEQRVMTRENLLAIADKYQMFLKKRESLSRTQLVDLMRERASLRPYELDGPRRRESLTVALTVRFEYEQPDVAMRVANDLLTLILNEDARSRTSRAQEATNFLEREVKKLESELVAVDKQILEFSKRAVRDPAAEKTAAGVALLRAEYQEKASLYTDAHPEMIRLKRQLAALEKLAQQATDYDNGLENLKNQRATIQKNLESAAQKAGVARTGENLERAQFSERLEVLEQAVLPQKPTKPNRPKMLALSLLLAVGAGVGCVMMLEMFSTTIWSARDLRGLVDSYAIVAVPYITTRKEILQRRLRAVVATGTVAALLLAGLLGTHLLIRPLDDLWATLVVRLTG